MRHDTPAALKRQSLTLSARARSVAAALAVAACLAGGLFLHAPASHAASSASSLSTHQLADGCTGTSGPCAVVGR